MAVEGRTNMVAIVDDDLMRSSLQGLLKAVGFSALAFASAEDFLKSGQQHQIACLIADIRMPGGLELQAKLNAVHHRCGRTGESLSFTTADLNNLAQHLAR
jgi:FixJ family two-component response regulator